MPKGMGFYYKREFPENEGPWSGYRENGGLYCGKRKEQKCSLCEMGRMIGVRGSDGECVHIQERAPCRAGQEWLFSRQKNIKGNYIPFMHAKEKKTENPGYKG